MLISPAPGRFAAALLKPGKTPLTPILAAPGKSRVLKPRPLWALALAATWLWAAPAGAEGLRPLPRPAAAEAPAPALLRPAQRPVAIVDAAPSAPLVLSAASGPHLPGLRIPSALDEARAEVAVLRRPGEVQVQKAALFRSPARVAAPAAAQVQAALATPKLSPDLRPMLRPAVLQRVTPLATATALPGLARSFRPSPRPALSARNTAEAAPEVAEVVQVAAVTPPRPGASGIFGKKGSVCGDRSIRGQTIPPIAAQVKGCGVAEPVRVTSIAGVKLSQAADIDCPTAIALKRWVEEGLQPQYKRNPVVQLQVAAHYICRPRNNIKGARISEHGRGRAIDISGFVLSDGSLITVASNYRGKARESQAMRAAHKAACGIFNTTLGPGSDGHHEDHLHFDTARGRGPYCR